MMRRAGFNLAALLPTTLAAMLAASLLAGCATPVTERYYRLAYAGNDARSKDAPADISYEVIVGSVQIPEAVNRAQLVVQKTATESVISDDQRWVAPLDEQIGQAVTANLRSSLPGAWLANAAAAGVTAGTTSAQGLPRYHLKIQVEQLVLQSGERVVLEASWILQDSSRKMLRRERTVVDIPVSGPGYDPLAPAVSEAVRQLSAAIAKAVQAARAS